MQQIQLRIANVVMDLYALAACIARTTLAIEERGESGARREIDLTGMFASAAQGADGREPRSASSMRTMLCARPSCRAPTQMAGIPST